MKRRIVIAIVMVAGLAVIAFGVPLGVVLDREFESQALLRLERAAILAERDIPAGWVPGDAVSLDRPTRGAALGLYDSSGSRVFGAGPVVGDEPVRVALGDRVGEAEGSSSYVIAVPIARGGVNVGALRAEQHLEVTDRRIRAALASMALLAIAIVGGAALLAVRLARRIAVPLESLHANAAVLGTDGSTYVFERSGLAELDDVAAALAAAATRVADSVDRERAFSADVSHQLRTPITGLRLLIETELVAPRADPTAVLHESAAVVARLESTVDELLSLSRNRLTDRVELDVASLVGDLARRWVPVYARADRQLDVVTPESMTAPVVASPSAIEQILDVLVDNALRHGIGVVAVSYEAVAGGIALRVTDGGDLGGVDVESLFAGRPRGADTSTVLSRRGIGLGLARRLAQVEGGELVCTSRSPTTFSVLIAAI